MSQPDPQQQDPYQEPNAAEVLGNVISGIGQLFSSIQGWIQSGAGVLTLLCAIMLGTGGVIGHFTTNLLGSSGSTEISIIKGASIEKTDNKGNPATGKDDWLVRISFPDPRGPLCDGECENELRRVTEGFRGCTNRTCEAELKNTDQQDLKTGASSHIQGDLDKLVGSPQKVDLVVSGSRINAESEYPNIILVRGLPLGRPPASP